MCRYVFGFYLFLEDYRFFPSNIPCFARIQIARRFFIFLQPFSGKSVANLCHRVQADAGNHPDLQTVCHQIACTNV